MARPRTSYASKFSTLVENKVVSLSVKRMAVEGKAAEGDFDRMVTTESIKKSYGHGQSKEARLFTDRDGFFLKAECTDVCLDCYLDECYQDEDFTGNKWDCPLYIKVVYDLDWNQVRLLAKSCDTPKAAHNLARQWKERANISR